MRFLIKIVCIVGVLALASAAHAQVANEEKDDDRQGQEGEGSVAEEKDGDEVDLAPSDADEEDATPEEVHERRMVQLRRLRDLAVENERKDMISRVDGLIARELKRHAARKDFREKGDVDEDSAEETEE